MIGMSLAYKQLLSAKDSALDPDILLPQLWEHGVRSIELRSISPKACPAEALRVANLLWDYGFQITVHAQAKSAESAVKDVFAPLSDILANMRQHELTVTVHPVVGDNAAMLVALSDHITEHNFPVRIALENNRKMPDGTIGNSAELVLDAVTRADRQNVGICFDMGHWAWYTSNFTDDPNMLPPKEFLQKAIHTHIHTCSEDADSAYTAGAKGSTHFPLDEWREPLSLYIGALGYKYFGVYNIELSPKRYEHKWGAAEAYLLSADTLKAHYPPRAEYHDWLRLHYDGCFRRSLEVFDKKTGCYGTLIAPSAYLFSTNGYKWAMDVSFLELYRLAETPSRVREYLGDIDCMILTHGHGDHTEKRTISALADTDINWIVPEFLVDNILSLGVRPEKITSVRAGDEISAGPLSIRVLEGKHFRPVTNKGIDAVGYLISADGAATLAFPGDIRDYSTADGEELNADHCFAHVWLTDKALDPEMYIPKSREFAEFMLTKSRKSILLAHLYANRAEDKRWSLHHARVVSDTIHELSPETLVRVPRYGEIFNLTK